MTGLQKAIADGLRAIAQEVEDGRYGTGDDANVGEIEVEVEGVLWPDEMDEEEGDS
ncbi:MAG: hypothetical protein IMZ57_06895 [Acidobacteria bacterium]|nr:hypothetical protein [Acidobacteriota bacterium]